MRIFDVPRPRLGLLKQVEQLKAASEATLFPELSFDAKNGPAGGIQHAFSRYLVKLDIKARGGGRVGHRSFRDTVIDALKAAGVHREMLEGYTGHELSDRQEQAHDYDGVQSEDAGCCLPPSIEMDWSIAGSYPK